MNQIRIEGFHRLNGEVRIQGSKNAALPMMAAAVLCNGEVILHHCPDITDVHLMKEIIKGLGGKAFYKNHTMYLDCTKIERTTIPKKEAEKMRSSIVLMGSLLGRKKEVCIPWPGGCVIGKRPIDLHLSALEKMGAEFTEEDRGLKGKTEGLKGTRIVFPKISVGATQNVILASVLAKGTTILENCACEPEVQWLCRFLRKGGAKIKETKNRMIEIEGIKSLHAVEYEVPPDRIVAGTYLCASAITRSNICLDGAPKDEMKAILSLYQKMGGQYEWIGGKLSLCSQKVNVPVLCQKTEVYPGFPTDLQSPVLAVLSGIKGKSCLVETIFENRFRVAGELKKMGANIRIDGAKAEIYGGKLHGAEVEAQELRGGAALVLAGLAAKGVTTVKNIEYIERGYEDICRDLSLLGAVMERK